MEQKVPQGQWNHIFIKMCGSLLRECGVPLYDQEAERHTTLKMTLEFYEGVRVFKKS